jgi:hypothetical protein
VLIGGRFLLLRSRTADQTSFLLYNVSPDLSIYRFALKDC